ncbi:MAG: family 16 glycoside hydrolase [Oscillochloridaceae bacterium umkhey_bin13]
MMRHIRTGSLVAGVVITLVVAAVAVAFWPAPRGVAQSPEPLLQYPDFPPTPTVGPNPTTAPSLAGTTLFSSRFDGPAALDAWKLVDLEFVLSDSRSNWGITPEGRLEQQTTGRAFNPSIQRTAALTGSADWRDYRVQVSFYDQFNGTAGLIARYQGDDPTTASYYRYAIIKDSFEATPKQVLEKIERGVATTLVAIPGPGFEERTWNVLQLEVVGNTITVTLNGQVVIEAEDAAPLISGKAGIYTRAIGGIFFDDVSVTTP